jgi:hypothetical protein
MPIGIHRPDSKAGHFLTGESKLSHPLMSGNELLGYLLEKQRLLGEAVLGILLAMHELGLLLAASHKGLQ